MRSRSLLALLLAATGLACVTAFLAEPPKPKVNAFSVSVRRDAAASLVWVKWTLNATGGPDSTTVDVTGPTNLHRKYTATSKVDSISYAAPAPNGTISGGASATAWRRGLPSAPMTPKPWSYTEPDVPPPPPTITVEVLPASVTLAPGGTQQFTATVKQS